MSKISKTKHVPITVMPSLPEDVPPTLRFMLTEEARAEAANMHRELKDRICWSNSLPGSHRRVDFVEKYLVSRFNERWPTVARADAALDGLLTEVMRVFAATPTPDFVVLAWWTVPFRMLSEGRPDQVRSICEDVISRALGTVPAVSASLPEEAPDPIMKAAVRHWQDVEYEGPDLAGD